MIRRLLPLLLLVGCPSEEVDEPAVEPVAGLVPVGAVVDGDILPAVLDGDAFSVSLVSDQFVTVFADNDARRGDLYVVVFDGDDQAVAGPGINAYRDDFLNADWGCSHEPANNPPQRPRGCPDNSFVVEDAGVYTVVISAHDGLEPTVGYSMSLESEGVALRLEPTELP